MNNHIRYIVFKELEDKKDKKDTVFLLQQFELMGEEGFDYKTLVVALSHEVAMAWIEAADSTINVNGIPYPVRRYERMRIVHNIE